MERGNITKEDYRRHIWQRVNEIEDITLLAGIWIFVDEIAYREKNNGKPQREKQEEEHDKTGVYKQDCANA